MAETVQAYAPGLATLVDEMRRLTAQIQLFIEDNAQLRKTQAMNSARAYFGQPLVTPGLAFVDNTAAFRIDSSQFASVIITELIIIIDATSGNARYRFDGPPPGFVAASTSGILVPAGGAVLSIPGNDNARNFAIVAEPGAQLTGWVQPMV